MRPNLFEVPGLGPVPSYMVFLMVGFVVCVVLARREEDRMGRNGDLIGDMGILMLVAGILGARLLSVLADGHLMDFVHLCTDPKLVPALDAQTTFCKDAAECGYHYLCDTANGRCYPPQDCFAALKFWQGGLTFYGGLLLAMPAGLWFAHRKQMGVWRIADLTAPYVMLGLFFGRLGCFFNGCCYGESTSGPLGVDFPGIPGGPLHPTQLYEALGALVIFASLYWGVRPAKTRHGQVFGVMLMGYGALRFCLEMLRADERGEYFGLATSQWISIPLVLAGACILAIRRRPKEET